MYVYVLYVARTGTADAKTGPNNFLFFSSTVDYRTMILLIHTHAPGTRDKPQPQPQAQTQHTPHKRTKFVTVLTLKRYDKYWYTVLFPPSQSMLDPPRMILPPLDSAGDPEPEENCLSAIPIVPPGSPSNPQS